MYRYAFLLLAPGCLSLGVQHAGVAQQPATAPTPEQIHQMLREVATYQEAALVHNGIHFRYRTHRVDPKEDTTRDLIESSEGNVARLLLHRGKPLTADEDEGERSRLEKLLKAGNFHNRQKDEQKTKGYGVELMRAMPDAMLYTLAPGQPQLPGTDRKQVVLNFSPNPAFHAHTIAEGLLDGISGRLWIDAADHHLLRIEINITRDLTLAWGVLVKVYKGGTVEYDQQRIEDGVYAFSHVRTQLQLREFMVRNAPYISDLTATDIHPITPVPTGPEAVRMLLNESVPKQ